MPKLPNRNAVYLENQSLEKGESQTHNANLSNDVVDARKLIIYRIENMVLYGNLS